MSQAGRPVSGFVRPGTQSGRPGTMEQAIRTPRTAQTARYLTPTKRIIALSTVLFGMLERMLKVNNHPLRKWLIVEAWHELFIQVSIGVYLERHSFWCFEGSCLNSLFFL